MRSTFGVGLVTTGPLSSASAPTRPTAGLLASLLTAARTCAASIDAAPPDTRGFHPAGAADPEGFATMACDELLVHGRDAAIGLGLPFSPDPDLAARVVARLFPWHRASEDPWPTLLWANGRIELPGLPRQREWRWHSAPLSEWDGRPGPGRGASCARLVQTRRRRQRVLYFLRCTNPASTQCQRPLVALRPRPSGASRRPGHARRRAAADSAVRLQAAAAFATARAASSSTGRNRSGRRAATSWSVSIGWMVALVEAGQLDLAVGGGRPSRAS